jgi:hypothetical protein
MRIISNLLLTLLAILFSTTALSQTVTLSKTASVGCPDTPAIHGAVMTQDRYGNLYLASTANQGTIHGDFDIVKVSPSGNVVFQFVWSTPGMQDDEVNAITTDRRGDVIVTGTTTYTGGGFTQIVMTTLALAPDGSVLWYTTSTIGFYSTIPTCLTTDSAGNILIAGSTVNNTADFFVLKVDSAGNRLWTTIYDGTASQTDQITAIATDALANVYVTGESMGQVQLRLPNGRTSTIPEGFDYETIKYNANGQTLWANRYATTGADIPTAMTLDVAGNVYITGSSNNSGTTVCYNNTGTQQWALRSTTAQNFTSIALDPSGNVVTAGYDINAGALNYILTKSTSAGSLTWSINAAAGPYVPLNFGPNVALAIDRESYIYLTGETITSGIANAQNLNFWTLKYTAAGTLEWSQIYDGPESIGDVPSCIAIAEPSPPGPFRYPTVYVGGYSDMGVSGTLTLLTYTQYYKLALGLTATDALTGKNESLDNSTPAATLSNYPNPFHGTTNIAYTISHDSHVTLQVFTASGNLITTLADDNETAGPHNLPLSSARLAAGIYLYRMVATSPQGNFITTNKMIIQ